MAWPEDLMPDPDSNLPHNPPWDLSLNQRAAEGARNATQAEQAFYPIFTRTKSQSLNFEGTGVDRDPFHCTGQLQALPPQHGIPGWQRITLMKYFLDEDGFYDPNSRWAYEGVVLPGNQIILGRWWSPLHSEGAAGMCGPFIFWKVRGADGEAEIEMHEDAGGSVGGLGNIEQA